MWGISHGIAQHGDVNSLLPRQKTNPSDVFEACRKVVPVVFFNGTAVPWRLTEILGASSGRERSHGILVPEHKACARRCGLTSYFTPTKVS